MESILSFSPDQYFNFFLVVLRTGGLFLTAPILSSPSVPRQLRLFMTLLISLLLYSSLPLRSIAANWDVTGYFLLAVRETMIGLLLGVIPRAMFAAIDLAGTIIGFQMGLSIANVVDPQSQIQVSMIASLEGLLATLLFVTLDGHHLFFEVMASSYDSIPLGAFDFSANKIDFLLRLGGDMIILGVKLASPFIVALLLANVILGFMARAMPQMNIFVVGLPMTVLMGFIFLWTGMPYIIGALTKTFGTMQRQLVDMISIMAH